MKPATPGSSVLYIPEGNVSTGGVVKVRVFPLAGKPFLIDNIVPAANYDEAFLQACEAYDAARGVNRGSTLVLPGSSTAPVDPRKCPTEYTPGGQKQAVPLNRRTDGYVALPADNPQGSLVIRFRDLETTQTINVQRTPPSDPAPESSP